MKIVIPTIGSRGDVQPFIALAQGLIQVGHNITLASHPVMEPLVQSHGVGFLPMGPDIDLAWEAAAILQRSRSPAMGLVRAMRFSFDMLDRSHEDILALCREADLVVVPAQSAAGKNEADQLGLPYLSVTFMPWAIPWHDPDRPIVKRVVYRAIDELARLITTRPLNRIRKRQGIPPVGEEGFTSTKLNLVPVSPAVYPPNPLWEPHNRVVGFWFAEPPQKWEPSASLQAFLDGGDAPVLISLGAMSLGDGDALETASLFVEAVQLAGVRAIIQGWEGQIDQLTLPMGLYAAGPLPHSWLLPRCAAVVHHGGFGTTAAGMRAGIPALVVPHIADQFYWGQRVYELGVGPQPIRRPKLEISKLAASLDELVRNQKQQDTASTLGHQIQNEKGVDQAVRLIDGMFG